MHENFIQLENRVLKFCAPAFILIFICDIYNYINFKIEFLLIVLSIILIISNNYKFQFLSLRIRKNLFAKYLSTHVRKIHERFLSHNFLVKYVSSQSIGDDYESIWFLINRHFRRVQTRAGGTCTTSSCTYIFAKESDPFTFVPFRLSVSFILHLSPSFYIFLSLLSLLLFCMTDTLLAKIYAGIRIRMLRYIIVINGCVYVCMAKVSMFGPRQTISSHD